MPSSGRNRAGQRTESILVAHLSNFLMVPFISNIIMLVVQMDPSSLNFFCNPPFSFSPFSNSPDFKGIYLKCEKALVDR